MKKIFNIKVATILLAIVTILGAFGLFKGMNNTSFDTPEDEKPYCKIKKEDVLHNVKPASMPYALYSDYELHSTIHSTIRRYDKFTDKLYESQSKLRKLNIQFMTESITPEGVKPMTKEQQDTLDKAKKEIEKNYQELKIQYSVYKPIVLALLNEVHKRQEIERKKGIKPEKSYFRLYAKYSDYRVYDIDCIHEEDKKE